MKASNHRCLKPQTQNESSSLLSLPFGYFYAHIPSHTILVEIRSIKKQSKERCSKAKICAQIYPVTCLMSSSENCHSAATGFPDWICIKITISFRYSWYSCNRSWNLKCILLFWYYLASNEFTDRESFSQARQFPQNSIFNYSHHLFHFPKNKLYLTVTEFWMK